MRYRETFIIKHGERLILKGVDPAGKGHQESEPGAKDEIEHYRSQLAKLQSLLYAEKKRSILVVLQAMDAGGKDGVVNHVLSVLNPQGARVNGFQRPTIEEVAHDFLWRVHPHTPARGEIAIFNRSHYEVVLVPGCIKIIDTFRTWRDVRPESVIHSKADVDNPLPGDSHPTNLFKGEIEPGPLASASCPKARVLVLIEAVPWFSEPDAP